MSPHDRDAKRKLYLYRNENYFPILKILFFDHFGWRIVSLGLGRKRN